MENTHFSISYFHLQPLEAQNLELRGEFVDGDRALSLMNGMLWQSMLVSSPVLAVALLVGLGVSVLQVATQLQEMTLSYIPKLVASALMIVALGPWMMSRVTEFAISVIAIIPELG